MMHIASGAVYLYLVINRTTSSLYLPVPYCVALPKKCSEKRVLTVLLQIGAKDITVPRPWYNSGSPGQLGTDTNMSFKLITNKVYLHTDIGRLQLGRSGTWQKVALPKLNNDLLPPWPPVLLSSSPVLMSSFPTVLLSSCTHVLLSSCLPVLLSSFISALMSSFIPVLLSSCSPALLFFYPYIITPCLLLTYNS